jgi:TatD DNase family protein
MLEFPDVHCHLDGVVDPDRAVEEAVAAGVGPILTVGMQEATSTRCLDLRARHPDRVRAAVGLHPSEIPALDDAAFERELEFVHATLASADALGEVGLDDRDATDDRQRARQREALRIQLDWAAELRKPVSMHCRRAAREIVEIASDVVHRTGLGVNLHWFTHSEKLARRCAEAGLYISPGPSILFDERQARVATVIADAGLLLETDSPVEYDGEPARPAWAARVAARLAALRGTTPAVLAELLQANFRRYMGGAG